MVSFTLCTSICIDDRMARDHWSDKSAYVPRRVWQEVARSLKLVDVLCKVIGGGSFERIHTNPLHPEYRTTAGLVFETLEELVAASEFLNGKDLRDVHNVVE